MFFGFQVTIVGREELLEMASYDMIPSSFDFEESSRTTFWLSRKTQSSVLPSLAVTLTLTNIEAEAVLLDRQLRISF
jgi:hypothetical protein